MTFELPAQAVARARTFGDLVGPRVPEAFGAINLVNIHIFNVYGSGGKWLNVRRGRPTVVW